MLYVNIVNGRVEGNIIVMFFIIYFSVIAMSYEAKSLGIKRGMFSDDLKVKHPELTIFRVPEKRGKAELTKYNFLQSFIFVRYRSASAEVIECISEFTNNVEKASIDEAYIDLTGILLIPQNNFVSDYVHLKLNDESYINSFVQGYESYLLVDNTLPFVRDLSITETNCIRLENDIVNLTKSHFSEGLKLIVASFLVFELRQKIYLKTGFCSSAGIASNKVIFVVIVFLDVC